MLSRRFQWYRYIHALPAFPLVLPHATLSRAFLSPAVPISYLHGDGPAESHLEDPELFAAYLKVLKDLVCQEDAARDVQDVQIMALCR